MTSEKFQQGISDFLGSMAIYDIDDGPGELGEPFDAFEIELVGEYVAPDGTTFCEPIFSDDAREEATNLMVTLYGHFARGGVVAIVDVDLSPEMSEGEAFRYMRRLAQSLNPSLPVH